MKIFKKNILKINDTATYILKNIGENFLINRNYGNTTDNSSEEFVLINKNLEIIGRTNIYKGPLSIYQVFPCEDGNRFLFHCSSQSVLVYGDFLNKNLFTITIDDSTINYFAYTYVWLENSILLVANEEIYECNIHEKKLQKIEMNKAKKLYGDFLTFKKECQDHIPTMRADFINQNYIYLENYLKFDGNQQIVYVDLKNNKIKKIADPYNKYHDIVFHKGYFIIVAKEMLTIVKDKKIYTYPMGDKSYIFARAAGIDDNEKLSFMVLECYEGREEKSDRLVRYELS